MNPTCIKLVSMTREKNVFSGLFVFYFLFLMEKTLTKVEVPGAMKVLIEPKWTPGSIHSHSQLSSLQVPPSC